MTSNTDTPESITGGCLCEGVRYKITFDPDHDFANSSTTCQCSQCRKNTGTLYFHDHSIPPHCVQFTSSTTLNRYYATPGIARGFCSRCGSFLFWHREAAGGNMCFAVGGFDKDVLLGKYGVLLTTSRRHLWCKEQIEGVTDHLLGERWEYDCEGEGAKRML